MFGRTRRPKLIEPGEWPEVSGQRRVLLEHGDGAESWGQAEILREAGYEVATCEGPSGVDWPRREALSCPLIETGRCALVAGADVVVTDCGLGQSEKLLAALAGEGVRVVFEAPAPLLDRYARSGGRAAMLAYPVTERALRTSVTEALARLDG